MGLSLCWLVLLSGFSAQFTCQFYLPNHLSAYCMRVWKERAVNSYTNSIAAFVSGLLQKAVFVLKRLKCQMRRGRCFSHFYTVCFHHTNVIVHTSPKSLKPCLALPCLSVPDSDKQRILKGGLCLCVSIISATHLPSVLSAPPRCTVQRARTDRERSPFFFPSWLTAKVQHYPKLWFLWPFCLVPSI